MRIRPAVAMPFDAWNMTSGVSPTPCCSRPRQLAGTKQRPSSKVLRHTDSALHGCEPELFVEVNRWCVVVADTQPHTDGATGAEVVLSGGPGQLQPRSSRLPPPRRRGQRVGGPPGRRGDSSPSARRKAWTAGKSPGWPGRVSITRWTWSHARVSLATRGELSSAPVNNDGRSAFGRCAQKCVVQMALAHALPYSRVRPTTRNPHREYAPRGAR
jgi:hypothetical protein